MINDIFITFIGNSFFVYKIDGLPPFLGSYDYKVDSLLFVGCFI